MKNLMVSSILALLVAAPGVAAAAPAGAVTAEASATLTADLSDDILLVLDLPIAAADLREDGVEEAEITGVIEGTVESGASAAVATEVLVQESEEVKTRGPKKGLGLYVRKLLADGLRGQELAAKIKERKEEFTLTDEEREALKADLQAKREAEKARRQELHAKIKEARKEGKAIKLRGELLHARLDERRRAEKAKHRGKVAKIKGEIREERAEGDKDAVKDLRGELRDEHAEHKDKMEKIDAREDKREDKLDAKAEKRADRVEAREEKREEKRENLKANTSAKKAAQ